MVQPALGSSDLALTGLLGNMLKAISAVKTTHYPANS